MPADLWTLAKCLAGVHTIQHKWVKDFVFLFILETDQRRTTPYTIIEKATHLHSKDFHRLASHRLAQKLPRLFVQFVGPT